MSRRTKRRHAAAPNLLEVVHDDLFHEGFDAVGDKFEVLGMDLVIVLGLFAGEDGAEGDLIGLIHDRAGAAHHFADMELGDAGDVLEIFISAGDDLVGSIGLGGIGPKNDDVREHKYGGVFLCEGI